MADKVVARMAVYNAGEMSKVGRRRIAKWLRHQADQLEKEGANYHTRYTAKYIGVDKSPNAG